MSMPSAWSVNLWAWKIFCLVWVLTGLRVKHVKSTEAFALRYFTMAATAAAFFVMFFYPGPLLRERLIPDRPGYIWTGVTLTYLGAAFAIWARFLLGSNWSSMVTVRQGHELINAGPYRYIRHPIYTGLFAAMIGTSIMLGELKGFLASVFLLAIHVWKARREEGVLTAEFGDAYRAYRSRTGFLLPGL